MKGEKVIFSVLYPEKIRIFVVKSLFYHQEEIQDHAITLWDDTRLRENSLNPDTVPKSLTSVSLVTVLGYLQKYNWFYFPLRL